MLGLRAALSLPVGAFFMSIGVLHLLLPMDYAGIVPPLGTWGIWLVPGSGLFHAYWTGIAHLLCGLALLVSEVMDILEWQLQTWRVPWRPPASEQICFFLWVQTIAVSPANVYMFTHGANTLSYLKPLGPIPYPDGHIYAFIGVVCLLGILQTLANLESSGIRRESDGAGVVNPDSRSYLFGFLGITAGAVSACDLFDAFITLANRGSS